MRTPEVSIGMPAYNSAATIGAAIEALLAQSYGGFELIVSDNASTDATHEVVDALARRDSRVRYERQPVNRGVNCNYSRVFLMARGRYFKWASSSDLCSPTFVERCREALESRTDAVLAAPRTRLFVGDPANFSEYAHDIEILGDAPSQRLKQLMSTIRLNNALNGLIRSAALRQTGLIAPYYAADLVCMAHLALLGKMLRVDEPLFYRRMEMSTSSLFFDSRSYRQFHYPTASARMLFQATKRHIGFLRAATMAPMPAAERWRTCQHVVRMAYWDRLAFFDDLRDAIRYVWGKSGEEVRQL